MGIRTDHGFTGSHQTLFRQQGVFNSHLAHIVIVVDIKLSCKGPALLALRCRLDVLIGCEMVHDQRNLTLIKYLIKASCFKLIDRHRRSDVVAQHQIQLCLDQLPRADLLQTGMAGKNLLCHRHSHEKYPLPLLSPQLRTSY